MGSGPRSPSSEVTVILLSLLWTLASGMTDKHKPQIQKCTETSQELAAAAPAPVLPLFLASS